MAKTKNAFFSAEARGKAGNLIAEQRREGQYIKSHVKPKDKKSPGQLKQRKLYGQAVQAWHQLPPDMKEVFDIKAKLNRMSGFNLFLKYFTTAPQSAIYGIAIYGFNKYGQIGV